ncbi:unnamed protein product, partial [Polarella glacialis]
VGLPHRGDVLKWVGYDGQSDAERSAQELTKSIEEAIGVLRQSSEREVPAVAEALSGIRWRSEAMMTCYPAESRARYFRHTDNSSGNGRLLTAILYLNEGWETGHGGELRLFQPGGDNLKVRTEVEPVWNRLLLFWSDDRCPHEVLSACQDRFACTVWYYDGPNPNVPLFDIDWLSKGSVSPPLLKTQVPLPPVVAAGARPPPQVAAAPTGQVAAEKQSMLTLFFDGRDPEIAQLAKSLELGAAAVLMDLHSAGAATALNEAGAQWSQMLSKEGFEAVKREAGSLFLLLPGGDLLKNCERERWLLQYELDYWRHVEPASASTRQRLSSTLFEPLGRLSSAFSEADGPWWAAPEAVDVWGKALAKENFLVLDNFLPEK